MKNHLDRNPHSINNISTTNSINIIAVSIVLMLVSYLFYDYFFKKNTVNQIDYQTNSIALTFMNGQTTNIDKATINKVNIYCVGRQSSCGVVLYSNNKQYKTDTKLTSEQAKVLRSEIYTNLE